MKQQDLHEARRRLQVDFHEAQMRHEDEAMVAIKQGLTSLGEADEMISFGLLVKEGRRPDKITVEYLKALFLRNGINLSFFPIQPIAR